MPRKNPRSRARKELPTTNKPVITNFDVVLRAVRAALKLDWCFYEEALEGVVRAGAQGGDVTPWLSQMQQLADRKPEIALSHEGVLFLLKDMGVKLSRPQEQGNKDDEERMKAINDMGNDMTSGGEFCGEILGYLPLADWNGE